MRHLLVLTKTLLPTFNVLEPTVTPVCNMPSAMPNRSTFRRKGVTKVTYVAPDHFLRKFRAHVSVDPPTLSRMKSNLGRKKQIKTFLLVFTQGSNPLHAHQISVTAHKLSCSAPSSRGVATLTKEKGAYPLTGSLAFLQGK